MICEPTVKRIFIVLCLLLACQVHAGSATNSSFSLIAELLYWELREGSDENWSQNITQKGVEQSATLHEAPFSSSPGFRVGFAYDAPSDAWNSALYYTYFRTNAKDSASGNVYSAYLGNFFACNPDGKDYGPFYDSAKVDWDFSFHSVDLEFGRNFVIDRILTVRPFVGLKAAVIKQDIDSHWFGPKEEVGGIIVPITAFSTAREKIKNDFWGIGPVLGLDTTWPLLDSLSIIGNFSGALMWGHWTFDDHYVNDGGTSIRIDTQDHTSAATMARGLLGLEWAKEFSRTSLSVHLVYEAQVWFDQVQYYNYNMGRLSNLMSLQGSSLGFRLNY